MQLQVWLGFGGSGRPEGGQPAVGRFPALAIAHPQDSQQSNSRKSPSGAGVSPAKRHGRDARATWSEFPELICYESRRDEALLSIGRILRFVLRLLCQTVVLLEPVL